MDSDDDVLPENTQNADDSDDYVDNYLTAPIQNDACIRPAIKRGRGRPRKADSDQKKTSNTGSKYNL